MAEPDAELDRPFRGRATIRDIADLSGVSIATVSRALNGRPDVAPGTREAVLRVAREQGFSARREPRVADTARDPVMLMLPAAVRASTYALLRGVLAAADESGLRVLITARDGDVPLLELMQRAETGALILVGSENAEHELRQLQNAQLPTVLVDPVERPPAGIPFVAAMHAAGARSAVEHLLELGHRRIGAIAGSPGSYATEERLVGLRTAYANAGLPVDPDFIVPCESTVAGGKAAAVRLLSFADPPTAIFGLDDNVMLGAVHAAHERGLHVPGELSIIGFADPDLVELITPHLTTVSQPRAEIGRMSVALLTRLIDKQAIDALGLELSTSLVVRESTAPPPGSSRAIRRSR